MSPAPSLRGTAGGGRRRHRHFERALLVAILVTRVFSFVESQFHAVFALAVDLLLFVALRGVTDPERRGAAVPPTPARTSRA